MVDEDAKRSAQEFRDTATRLKSLARQVRSFETRRSLLELAERFERMAAQRDPGPPKERDE